MPARKPLGSVLLGVALLVHTSHGNVDGSCDGAAQGCDTGEFSAETRFQKYKNTVCAKCERRGVDCGCEGDPETDADHAFGVLSEYMLQYEQWREAIAHQDVFRPQFVAVELKNGLGNQLLAFVNSLLVAICLKRALLVDRQTDYRYQDFGRRHVSPEGEVDSAFSASQAGAFDPVIDFLSQSEVVAHGSTHHLFMDQPDGVRKLLCDMSRESFAHHNVIAIGNSNEDPHMILDNPSCPYLRDAFRGVPFFFLSHFLWSGEQDSAKPVPIATLPAPLPWDGHTTVAQFHEKLRLCKNCHAVIFSASAGPCNCAGADLYDLQASGARSIAVHIRIAGNMQYHHFDHSHFFPDPTANKDHRQDGGDLEAFCDGHASSLDSVYQCLSSMVAAVESMSRIDAQGGIFCYASADFPGSWSPCEHAMAFLCPLFLQGLPLVVLWATDNYDLSAHLFNDIVAMPGVSVVTIQHGVETSNGLASGMIDMELLGGATQFVGTPQSTYSFAAHARGLIVPKYGSYARHGQACAVGRGAESGLLSLGPLMRRCWQIGWNLTCHDVAEECLALVSGHPRLGECLQDLGQRCRGRDPTWAADYLLDFRHMDFLVQFWARHGGVIDYTFPHQGWLPACWPYPSRRSPYTRDTVPSQ